MDNDQRFWICVFLLAVVVVCVIGALCAVNAMHRRNSFVDAVRAGADPIDVSCALDIPDSTSLCLLARRKAQ